MAHETENFDSQKTPINVAPHIRSLVLYFNFSKSLSVFFFFVYLVSFFFIIIHYYLFLGQYWGTKQTRLGHSGLNGSNIV